MVMENSSENAEAQSILKALEGKIEELQEKARERQKETSKRVLLLGCQALQDADGCLPAADATAIVEAMSALRAGKANEGASPQKSADVVAKLDPPGNGSVDTANFLEYFGDLLKGSDTESADAALACYSGCVIRLLAERHQQYSDDTIHVLMMQRERRFKTLFACFDLSRTGSIDTEAFFEIGQAIHGQRWTYQKNQQVLERLDTDGNGTVEEPECALVLLWVHVSLSPPVLQSLIST